MDDPMSLLYNMNDCYSKLKELVPSIPQNKKVSKMEILQHVIDYILDLQIALDSHPSIVSLHHQRPGQNPSSRTPLTTLNTDISILSLQVSAFPRAPPLLPGSPLTAIGEFGAVWEVSVGQSAVVTQGGTGRGWAVRSPPAGAGSAARGAAGEGFRDSRQCCVFGVLCFFFSLVPVTLSLWCLLLAGVRVPLRAHVRRQQSTLWLNQTVSAVHLINLRFRKVALWGMGRCDGYF